MRPELAWARTTTVETLSNGPTLVPWAFEYTPASSDAADATYLAKVREADFCIWLVGEVTTEPVRNEVAEALAADTRIWAITLPAATRDDVTVQLLSEVRDRAKTATAANAEELRELLELTFSDEVIRALRGSPGMTRVAQLAFLARLSRERMVGRWTAAGLSRTEATALADDEHVGSSALATLESAAHPVSILVGDVGAGKSVTGERFFQQGLLAARDKVSAPVPMWLHTRNASAGLDQAMQQRSQDLGDYRIQGAWVVIDGADEVDAEVASRVIDEARELAHALPNTRILITSRPVPAISRNLPERVDQPLLAEEEALGLIERVSGAAAHMGIYGGWPAPIRDAVRRPLFAILMGIERRAGATPRTPGELLGTLAAGTAEPGVKADAIPVLRHLAQLVTERQGPVERKELGDASRRVLAEASRVVREESGLLDFGLPLLTQWFAADALLAGDITITEIAESCERLDRWRYALAIALSLGTRPFVDDTMGELAAADPAFAAEVVQESFQQWGTTSSSPVSGPSPTSLEAGHALHQALTTWDRSVGAIGGLLLPHTDDGTLRPIGVAVREGCLDFAWRRGTTTDPAVSDLTVYVDLFSEGSDWLVERGSRWADETGWAWRWTLDLLRDHLKRILDARSFTTSDPGLLREDLWLAALDASGRRGSGSPEPVPLSLLEQGLARLDPNASLTLADRRADTSRIIEQVHLLRAEGATEVSPPWPQPDQLGNPGGGYVWDLYSPEQLRRRTEVVYTAAIQAYENLVTAWLEPFRPRLRTAVTLPAVLRGTLRVTPPGGPTATQNMRMASITWYFDALPRPSESSVEIVLGTTNDERPRDWADWKAQGDSRYTKLLQLRPEAAGWLSSFQHHGVVDVCEPAPVGPIVYKWLMTDLSAINWA